MNKSTTRILAQFLFASSALSSIACKDSATVPRSGTVPSADGLTECTENCEIVLRRLVSLSDSAKPGLLGTRPNIQRAVDGRYYTTISDYSGFAVYDSAGRFLHVFGRRGNGPGEFTFLSNLAPYGKDTLFAFDQRSGRLSVIADDSAAVRSISAFPAIPSLLLRDGSILIAEQLRDPKHIGWPLHIVGQDGKILRSFGAGSAQFRPDLDRVLMRVVGRGAGPNFWAAAPGRYVLEQWDPVNSKLLKTVKVDAEWFQETDHAPRYTYLQERPTPIIVSVWSTDDKQVWTLIVTADEKWRQRQAITDASERRSDPVIYDESFDFLLQAVDANSGKIIASKRLDSNHWAMPPSSLLVSHSDTSSASVVFDVWQPTLQRRAK